MNCKYCNAELLDDETVCSVCGKKQIEEKEVEYPEEISAENEQEVSEGTEKPKGKLLKMILAIVGGAALLVGLTLAVLYGMGIDLRPRANDVNYKDSYTVSDKQAQNKADKVVATVNGAKLTNAELQVHYWMQIDAFLGYYGTGYFDYQKPLDTQYMQEGSKTTWQQYFIDVAINSWQYYQIMRMLAEQGEYSVIDDYQEELKALPERLAQMAKEGGFENADAMIQADMGAACTAQDYINYVELYNISVIYSQEKFKELMPTQAEAEEYFTTKEAEFTAQGIGKNSGSVVDVRHILVQLDEPKADATGKVTYSDDQWEQCRQQAQKLLDEWKNADADEAHFAELANKHSKDGGSNTKGGLYTKVEKGVMVEPFENWIFDTARKAGDTGLVKTDFGYHIMYFVNAREKWLTAAEEALASERFDTIVENAEAQWPMTVNYKNIALSNIEW